MFKKINVLFLIILLTGSIVFAQNSEPAVGESELLWVHNFQFFQYDYKIGATLVEKNDNCNIWIENSKVTAVTVDADNSLIYAGTKSTGVFQKSITDDSWTSLASGLPNSSRLSGVSAVNVLFLTTDGMLLAGTDDGMYRWDNDMAKWRRASISDPVWSIAETDGMLFAGIGGYVWADDSDEDGDIDIDMGIYTSTNGGLTWGRQTFGIPMDNDDEHLAVYDLKSVDGTVLATTDAGVFQSANQGAFWKGIERTIQAIPANIRVDMTNSALNEDIMAELELSTGSRYERYLAASGISREDKVVIVEYDDDGNIVRKWTCPANDTPSTDPFYSIRTIPGIVGDEGKWTVKLNFYDQGIFQADDAHIFEDSLFVGSVTPIDTTLYDTTWVDEEMVITPIDTTINDTSWIVNENYWPVTYFQALDVNDVKYRGEPATATIVDPESELLLLVSYPEDDNFEVGGKFITVEYTDGADTWVWSVKATSMRGLNNDKKGILLDNDHLVMGDPIDNYDALNDAETIAKMNLSTSSGLVFSKLVFSDTDQTIYAGSDNGVYKSTDLGASWNLIGSAVDGLENIDIQSLLLDSDGSLYAGTLDNIFKKAASETTWVALNPIEAQTQIYTLAKFGEQLIAGTPYGCFVTANDGATWSDHNLGLQANISEEELANIVDAVENSTPTNPAKGIYQTITDQFGVENVPDTDENSKIDILFHEIFEKGRSEDQTSNGNYGTTKITGYFRPEDQNLIGNTNRHDFIYVDSEETTENEKIAAIAHQLMRMIIWNSDYDEERWVSEGIGYIAEKLCGYKLPTAMPNFKSLTGAAAVFSLVSGTPLSPWAVNPQNGDMNNRLTMVSMFATYLYENFGGNDLFVSIMQEPENGWLGIQNVLHNQGKNFNFDDVYAAWAMTLAINDKEQSDPITEAKYGYQDSLYSAVLETNKATYTLGMNSQAIFGHNPSMALYDEYNGYQENTQGMNNWAFIIRYFFPNPSLEADDPDSAIVDYWGKDKQFKNPETGEYQDIRYRINAMDDANLRVQLIKMTPEGHFDVENITPTFNDEKELSFNVLSKYEPYKNSSNKTLLKYHKMWVMISNQDSLGRAAKFVQVKDNTPPVVQYQLVHNPAYPEFVDIFVVSNEHTFYDVGAENEDPTVDMVYFTDTTQVEISSFDHIYSIGNQSEYFFYKGRYHLTEEGEVTLVIRKLQDLPGNDTEDITNTLSVRKANPQFANTLSTPNKEAVLTLPQGTLAEETFLTAYDNESRAQSGLDKSNTGMSVCSDIYNFGPINKSLNKSATLTIKYDKDLDLAKMGLFRLENEKWIAVPAVIHEKAGTISASVEKLGVYALLTGDQVETENAGDSGLPTTYAVYQNYPNPFNPVTEIKYQLPEQAHVQMQVYNMQGQLVNTLIDQNMEAGYHTVRWNGLNQAGYKVSTGVYFYKISAGNFTETKKMILIK